MNILKKIKDIVLASFIIIFSFIFSIILVNFIFSGFDINVIAEFLKMYLQLFISTNKFFMYLIFFPVLLPGLLEIYLARRLNGYGNIILIPLLGVILTFFLSVFSLIFETGDMIGLATSMVVVIVTVFQLIFSFALIIYYKKRLMQ